MEKAKKLRTVQRSQFTKQYALLKEFIDQQKLLEARGSFATLEQVMNKLSLLDEEILEFLMEDDDIPEDDLAKETNSALEYRGKFELIKICVLDLNNSVGIPVAEKSSVTSTTSSSYVQTPQNYSIRLPHIEIRKFSGDPKEWLPFWNQFQRVHDDSNIPVIDKFFYLDQAIVRNSRAFRVFESFPVSEENYPLVINALKERFGREDVLIEVYIRELLSLTLPSNKLCGLTEIYDKLECRLRALETLGVTKGKCASILCPLLESCMTEEFLKVWQRYGADKNIVSAETRLENFMDFMKSEVYNEERIKVAMSGFSDSNNKNRTFRQVSPKFSKKLPIPTAAGLMSLNSKRTKCIFCDDSRHNSTDCYKARNLSYSERLETVKQKHCCLICMKDNHIAKLCKYRQKCALCDMRHVLLLCPQFKRSEANSGNDVVLSHRKNNDGPKDNSEQDSVLANVTTDSVLLPTLMVRIRGNGSQKVVRAILDTGSQRSYLLKRTAQEMNYSPVGEENVIHSLFGGEKSGVCKHSVYKLYLSSLNETYMCNFDVLDQEKICNDLPKLTEGLWTNDFKNASLSPDFFKGNTGPIEVLIGADVAAKLLQETRLLDCGLTAVKTRLGWTLMGKVPKQSSHSSAAMLVTSMLIDDLSISDLWKLELLGISDPATVKCKRESEQEATRFFQETLTIDSEGRYEVKMPWKDGLESLPTNYKLACKRLDATLSKLNKEKLYEAYSEVLEEWEKEGVIERVPDSEIIDSTSSVIHYLPHRHVVRENSTFKIRPVFDASAHEAKSPSLNDYLEKGSNLIEHIPSLILRFRLGKIGVIADIKRAFLQISVCPEDRNCLRFLWKDRFGKLVTYRHRRVVFGVVCSPYHLNAVLEYHFSKALENCKEKRSDYSLGTVETLMNSFYVDNLITSVDDEEQLQKFISEARSILAYGKFDLRGWEFTDQSLTDDIPKTKVLGLLWNRKDDTLSLNCEVFNKCPERITKRVILSMTHTVFDTIGFSCPVTLEPKLILRELWSTKYDWDDDLSEDIRKRFERWLDEMIYLSELKIRRWFLDSSEEGNWTVHTFCDASANAYASAIFLRVETSQGVSVQLIQAKTRVAPLKETTIPRLELLAALIGARLYDSLKETLPEHCVPYFWSDSTTVVTWIQRTELWATFVRNRVSEIRRLTKPEQWKHIPGSKNPADLPSRGCSPKQLLKSSWWEGPDWLRSRKEEWPVREVICNEDEVSKEKIKNSTSMTCETNDSHELSRFYSYFSSYEKNVRLIAWIMRFVNNCKGNKTKGELSLSEIQAGEIKLLKVVQRESFYDVKDKRICCLFPFEDENGLICVKTKVSNRPDHEYFRYPILLPKSHPIVRNLIMETHKRKGHISTQGIMVVLRERFWVLGGRRSIRTVVSKCIRCKRQTAKPLNTVSPPLPVERVREASAFEVSGVDLAGPLYLKNKKKAYICLFTCGVYRAIHLELLLSLSTEEFLQAFRRFIARRGRPSIVFSDNGTNFIGTENALKSIDWKKILEYSNVERIKWKFNPPAAPWWGGFFERLIGLVKNMMKRILGKSSLDYTELMTVLCDIESYINSRPLTYVSNDLNELTPLTPAMFVQDIRESGVPDLDVVESTSFDKRFKHRVKLKEDLRKRFRSEYLGQLKLYSKNIPSKIEVDDVVLIVDEKSKRIYWPMAKVIELLPGKDGVIRLVKLKTSNGSTMLRPVQKLCPILERDTLNIKCDLNTTRRSKRKS